MPVLVTAPSLLALIPMVLFLILTLRGKNYTLSVGIAAILGCILMGQGPKEFAGILVDNLGGTLGQIGLIIMFGSGLGVVMDAAGINQIIVNFVVKKSVSIVRKRYFRMLSWFSDYGMSDWNLKWRQCSCCSDHSSNRCCCRTHSDNCLFLNV